MGICGNPPHALAFSNIAFWISGAIVTNMRFCSRIFVALLALALILSGTIQVSYASAAMSPANMSCMIDAQGDGCDDCGSVKAAPCSRSEEHTSELQSLMRISYAVFCLKKKKQVINTKIKNS